MAEGSAYLRAAHQLIDADPKILDDPLAIRILGPGVEERVASERERLATQGLLKARTLLVIRSRYAEDELARAIGERGITQYVLLGAGLDTSPYRPGHPARNVRVFEVDHPDTQAWKLDKVAEAGIDIPANVCHVPVDFEKETAGDGLARAGFDPAQPAFFSWLGVTYYLELESIVEMFRYVAGLAKGSQIVFDFVLADEALSDERRQAIKKITDFIEQYSEPWLSRFDPEILKALLHDVGFSQTFHLTNELANERYCAERGDSLWMDFTTQMMNAIV